MDRLVSKLQYKTYETGEYADEKQRSLEETLTLIKTFPWEEERPFTTVQLTGPSVTIQNSNNVYLKLGLFFNDKFTVYLLSESDQLLESHFSTLEEACKVVAEFYKDELSYEKFEKHFFNINNKYYFITKKFLYRIGWRQIIDILLLVTICLFGFFMCYLSIVPNNSKFYTSANIFYRSVSIVFFVSFAFRLVFMLHRYQTSRNSAIELSKGKDDFSFTKDGVTSNYNKTNIQKIIIYGSDGRKMSNWLGISEIYFRGGEVLRISNFLIDVRSFRWKFSQELIVRSSRSQFLM